ncbi:uncharacterized protein LOC131429749 [Malaya genurostris]|uniref:uncharacterized protein LOC131429749 n=1 Tax=Malaya genurostris TaxID=325434 RepID=UPI0026F3EFE3|nr:uncharacterized protein LOC131429749 [Malaya genurostris]
MQFVAAKTKVAPLKHVTIPRLESMTALLGARLLLFVIENHTISVRKRFLWTDSATVLSWICSDHRTYRQFVACRVGEISSVTNECEWRWVPIKFNVADEATKGPCFDAGCRWYVGPDFLCLPEDDWPKQPTTVATKEEIRPCFIHQETLPTTLIHFDRFSSWNRLSRSLAYLVRAITFWKRKKIGVAGTRRLALSQEEIREGETLIWKLVQREVYTDELVLLSRNELLPEKERMGLLRSSNLYTLSPKLGQDGLIRLDGRIGATELASSNVKYPVILPTSHRVTNLLVDHYHRKFLHGNSEIVFNYYYVPRLRVLIRKIARQCKCCKVQKTRPALPRMARLSPYVRPFSFVGLDYFGPMLVRVGRSNAKRWIALFTCLTIRAVHVEVAHELSTQYCISCIRRFVCRRGPFHRNLFRQWAKFRGSQSSS